MWWEQKFSKWESDFLAKLGIFCLVKENFLPLFGSFLREEILHHFEGKIKFLYMREFCFHWMWGKIFYSVVPLMSFSIFPSSFSFFGNDQSLEWNQIPLFSAEILNGRKISRAFYERSEYARQAVYRRYHVKFGSLLFALTLSHNLIFLNSKFCTTIPSMWLVNSVSL